MVCIPCFIIPLLLYVFHRFIQPLILRFWNPWQKKDSEGNVIKTEPQLFQCKDGVCSFAVNRKKVEDNKTASKAENVGKSVTEIDNAASSNKKLK